MSQGTCTLFQSNSVDFHLARFSSCTEEKELSFLRLLGDSGQSIVASISAVEICIIELWMVDIADFELRDVKHDMLVFELEVEVEAHLEFSWEFYVPQVICV